MMMALTLWPWLLPLRLLNKRVLESHNIALHMHTHSESMHQLEARDTKKRAPTRMTIFRQENVYLENYDVS